MAPFQLGAWPLSSWGHGPFPIEDTHQQKLALSCRAPKGVRRRLGVKALPVLYKKVESFQPLSSFSVPYDTFHGLHAHQFHWWHMECRPVEFQVCVTCLQRNVTYVAVDMSR